jgi:hypothetical protein
MAKHKDIRGEDFKDLGFTSDQIKKIDIYLLRNNDFKKWCEAYHKSSNKPSHFQAQSSMQLANQSTPNVGNKQATSKYD